MKKCINGRVVEMTREEGRAMLESLLSQTLRISPEERLDKLEAGFSGLLSRLSKLLPGIEELG